MRKRISGLESWSVGNGTRGDRQSCMRDPPPRLFSPPRQDIVYRLLLRCLLEIVRFESRCAHTLPSARGALSLASEHGRVWPYRPRAQVGYYCTGRSHDANSHAAAGITTRRLTPLREKCVDWVLLDGVPISPKWGAGCVPDRPYISIHFRKIPLS
jgi:hypothetical protein